MKDKTSHCVKPVRRVTESTAAKAQRIRSLQGKVGTPVTQKRLKGESDCMSIEKIQEKIASAAGVQDVP